jgi:arachidonate 15-lipoxygenase
LYSDRIFAHLRLAGMNPVLVETATDIGLVSACAHLSEVRAEFERAGHGSLERAIDERRVTVLGPTAYDPLRVLRAAVEPEHPHQRRFFCRPTAVFVRRADEAHLRPVAIRCDPDFDTIRPLHGQIWERAKLHVQVADSLYQTFVSHLPQTHFIMEAVALATRRALGFGRTGSNHPIRRLLEPHLQGTMAVNRVARRTLLDGSSSFLEFVACDVHSTRALLSDAFTSRAATFQTTFEAGAIDQVDPGLVYPYRDDTARLRPVLREWIEAYVRRHYRNGNAEVARDRPLQAWARELVHHQHGRLPGVGKVETVDRLVEVLHTTISLATLQHSAFHFPQTDLGRLAYVIPFYAADVPPGQAMQHEGGLRRLDSLPDLHAAAWQSFILGQSTLRWGTLADLPSHFEGEDREAAETTWRKLEAAEAELVLRDAALQRDGLTPYPYLRPSTVPCSINT